MLQIQNLRDETFLDVGSGSGIFSLAGTWLGARVYSFDYNPNSVACTRELKRRSFRRTDEHWTVQEGSSPCRGLHAIAREFRYHLFLGLLRHTGRMWRGVRELIIRALFLEAGSLSPSIMMWGGAASRGVASRAVTIRRSSFPADAFCPGGTFPGQTKAFLESLLKLKPGEFISSIEPQSRQRG